MDLTYVPKIVGLFYFLYLMYLARYGPNHQKIVEFFNVISAFLRQANQTGDISESNDKVEEIEKRGEFKPKRFEDKYLEEYKNLSNEELTIDKLDSLKNNIVMENTPLGNVVMLYDNKKEAFVFYSDSTIPYRYLEVVGRKYVATYKCKNIFINMEEQLKVAEEKKAKKLEQKSENVEQNSDKINISTIPKKDVFAKLKSYNNNITKEAAGIPSKNAGSKDLTKKNNENIFLKDSANRYTYQGKLANFNFLRPIDKKQIDKRLAMSWADFKSSFN